MHTYKTGIIPKIISIFLVLLLVFNDVSQAAGPVLRGEMTTEGNGDLSAPSRNNPIATVTRDENGRLIVSADQLYTGELTRDLKEKAGVVYISFLIGRILDRFGSSISASGVRKVLASNIANFEDRIDFSRVKWEDLYKENDVFCLKYLDDLGVEKEFRYYLKDGRPKSKSGVKEIPIGTGKAVVAIGKVVSRGASAAVEGTDTTYQDLLDEGYSFSVSEEYDSNLGTARNYVDITYPGAERPERARISYIVVPETKVIIIDEFYPEFPEERKGRGRALLRHLLSRQEYAGYDVIALASGEFQRSFMKMPEYQPMAEADGGGSIYDRAGAGKVNALGSPEVMISFIGNPGLYEYIKGSWESATLCGIVPYDAGYPEIGDARDDDSVLAEKDALEAKADNILNAYYSGDREAFVAVCRDAGAEPSVTYRSLMKATREHVVGITSGSAWAHVDKETNEVDVEVDTRTGMVRKTPKNDDPEEASLILSSYLNAGNTLGGLISPFVVIDGRIYQEKVLPLDRYILSLSRGYDAHTHESGLTYEVCMDRARKMLRAVTDLMVEAAGRGILISDAKLTNMGLDADGNVVLFDLGYMSYHDTRVSGKDMSMITANIYTNTFRLINLGGDQSEERKKSKFGIDCARIWKELTSGHPVSPDEYPVWDISAGIGKDLVERIERVLPDENEAGKKHRVAVMSRDVRLRRTLKEQTILMLSGEVAVSDVRTGGTRGGSPFVNADRPGLIEKVRAIVPMVILVLSLPVLMGAAPAYGQALVPVWGVIAIFGGVALMPVVVMMAMEGPGSIPPMFGRAPDRGMFNDARTRREVRALLASNDEVKRTVMSISGDPARRDELITYILSILGIPLAAEQAGIALRQVIAGEIDRLIRLERGSEKRIEPASESTLYERGGEQQHGSGDYSDLLREKMRRARGKRKGEDNEINGRAIEADKIKATAVIGFISTAVMIGFGPHMPMIEGFVVGVLYLLATGLLPTLTGYFIRDRLSYRYHRKERGLIRPFMKAENIRNLYAHDADSRDKIAYYSYTTEKLYVEKAAMRRIPKLIQYVIYLHEMIHGTCRVRTELVALSLTVCAPWVFAGAALTVISAFFIPADVYFFAGFTLWNIVVPISAQVIARQVGVKRSFAGHNLISGLKWKHMTDEEVDKAIVEAAHKRTYDPQTGQMLYWRDWLKGGDGHKNVELITVPGRPDDIVVVKAGYDVNRDDKQLLAAIKGSSKQHAVLIIADDGRNWQRSRKKIELIKKQTKRFTKHSSVTLRTTKVDIRSTRYDLRRLRDLRTFYHRRLDRIEHRNIARESIASEVHGEVKRLETLLGWLNGKNIRHILFMGDYLGKTENGYEALDVLEEHIVSGRFPRVTMLMGKSEHFFLRSILGDERFKDLWPTLSVQEGPAVMSSLDKLADRVRKLSALLPTIDKLREISSTELTYLRGITPGYLEKLKEISGEKSALHEVSAGDLVMLQNLTDREISDLVEADAFERTLAATIRGRGEIVTPETLAAERRKAYRFHPKIIGLAEFMTENMRFVYSENSHHNLFMIGALPEDLERHGLRGIEALDDMENEFRQRTRCGLRLLRLISDMWMLSMSSEGEEGRDATLSDIEKKMLEMVMEERDRNKETGRELIPEVTLTAMEADLKEALLVVKNMEMIPAAAAREQIEDVFEKMLQHVAQINKEMPEIYDTVFQTKSSPFMTAVPHGIAVAEKSEEKLRERRTVLGVDAVSTPNDFTSGFQTLKQVRVFTRLGRVILLYVDTLDRENPMFEETIAARTVDEIIEGRSLETITRGKLSAVEEILSYYESLLRRQKAKGRTPFFARVMTIVRSVVGGARRAIDRVRAIMVYIGDQVSRDGVLAVMRKLKRVVVEANDEYGVCRAYFKEGFEMVRKKDYNGLIMLEQVFTSETASPEQRKMIMDELLSHMKLNEDEMGSVAAFEVLEEILSAKFAPGYNKFMNRIYKATMDKIYFRLADVGVSDNEKKYRMYISRHILNAMIRNERFYNFVGNDALRRKDQKEKEVGFFFIGEVQKKRMLKNLLGREIGLQYKESYYEDITSRDVFTRAYRADMEAYVSDVIVSLTFPGSDPTLAYLDIMEYLEHPATTNLKRHAWVVGNIRKELPRLVEEKIGEEKEEDRVITLWDLGSGHLTPVLFAAIVLEEFDKHPEWGRLGERVTVKIKAVDINDEVGGRIEKILEEGFPYDADELVFRRGKDMQELEAIRTLRDLVDSAKYRERIKKAGMIEFVRGSIVGERNILEEMVRPHDDEARSADIVYMSFVLWQLAPEARRVLFEKLSGLPERSRIFTRLHGTMVKEILYDVPFSLKVAEPENGIMNTGCRYVLSRKPLVDLPPWYGPVKSDLLGKDSRVKDEDAALLARENAVFNTTSERNVMATFLEESGEARAFMRTVIRENRCGIKISSGFGRLAMRDGNHIWMDRWLFDIKDESEFIPKLVIFTALLAHQTQHDTRAGPAAEEFWEEVRACSMEIKVYIENMRKVPGLDKAIRDLLAGSFDLERIACDDVLDIAASYDQDIRCYDRDGQLTKRGVLQICEFVGKYYDKFRSFLDVRPSENALLAPCYVGHDQAVKRVVNPDNLPMTGLYAAAGADISNFLLSTNCTTGIFVDSTEITENRLRKACSTWSCPLWDDQYAAYKYEFGFGKAALLHNPRMGIWMEDRIIQELHSIGVERSDILGIDEVSIFPGGPNRVSIRFLWAYPGEGKKERRIIYVPAAIHKPLEYPDDLNELLARRGSMGLLDMYYQRAAMDVPNQYVYFLGKIAAAIKPGGFVITDDHTNEDELSFPEVSPERILGVRGAGAFTGDLLEGNPEAVFWDGLMLRTVEYYYGSGMRVRKKAPDATDVKPESPDMSTGDREEHFLWHTDPGTLANDRNRVRMLKNLSTAKKKNKNPFSERELYLEPVANIEPGVVRVYVYPGKGRFRVKTDKQGRFVLPEEYRDNFPSGDVTVSGCWDHLLLWDSPLFEKTVDEYFGMMDGPAVKKATSPDMSLSRGALFDRMPDGDTTNPFILEHIASGKVFEINADASFARTVSSRGMSQRGPPMEKRVNGYFGDTGIFEKIRKAKEPALLSSVLDRHDNFRNLTPAQRNDIIGVARKITLSVILGEVVVGEKASERAIVHTRTGFSRSRHGLDPTIWIGEVLLGRVSVEDLARIILEETQHVIKPPERKNGTWMNIHGNISGNDSPEDVIEHDREFVDKLDISPARPEESFLTRGTPRPRRSYAGVAIGPEGLTAAHINLLIDDAQDILSQGTVSLAERVNAFGISLSLPVSELVGVPGEDILRRQKELSDALFGSENVPIPLAMELARHVQFFRSRMKTIFEMHFARSEDYGINTPLEMYGQLLSDAEKELSVIERRMARYEERRRYRQRVRKPEAPDMETGRERRITPDMFEDALESIFVPEPGTVFRGETMVGGHNYKYSMTSYDRAIGEPVYFRAGDIFVINPNALTAAISLGKEKEFEALLKKYPMHVFLSENDDGEGWRNYSHKVIGRESGAFVDQLSLLPSVIGILLVVQSERGEITGRTFVDIGSRNGLLANAALKLGAARAVLIENNVPAVRPALPERIARMSGITKEDDILDMNVKLNGMSGKAEIFREDLGNVPAQTMAGAVLCYDFPDAGFDYTDSGEDKTSLIADIANKFPEPAMIIAGGGRNKEKEDLKKEAVRIGFVPAGEVAIPYHGSLELLTLAFVPNAAAGSPYDIFMLLLAQDKPITAEELRLSTRGRMPDGHLSIETVKRDIGTLLYLKAIVTEHDGDRTKYSIGKMSPSFMARVKEVLKGLGSRPTVSDKKHALDLMLDAAVGEQIGVIGQSYGTTLDHSAEEALVPDKEEALAVYRALGVERNALGWKENANGTRSAIVGLADVNASTLRSIFRLKRGTTPKGELILIEYGHAPIALCMTNDAKQAIILDLTDMYGEDAEDNNEDITEVIEDVLLDDGIVSIRKVRHDRSKVYARWDRAGKVVEILGDGGPWGQEGEGKEGMSEVTVLPGVFAPDCMPSMMACDAVFDLAGPGKRVLIVGSGTGLEAKEAAARGAVVDAVDIRNIAVENARLTCAEEIADGRVRVFRNDLLSGLERYDLIVFNMPHAIWSDAAGVSELEEDELDSSDREGRLLKRMSGQIAKHLSASGKAVIINNRSDEVRDLIMEYSGLAVEVLDERLYEEEGDDEAGSAAYALSYRHTPEQIRAKIASREHASMAFARIQEEPTLRNVLEAMDHFIASGTPGVVRLLEMGVTRTGRFQEEFLGEFVEAYEVEKNIRHSKVLELGVTGYGAEIDFLLEVDMKKYPDKPGENDLPEGMYLGESKTEGRDANLSIVEEKVFEDKLPKQERVALNMRKNGKADIKGIIFAIAGKAVTMPGIRNFHISPRSVDHVVPGYDLDVHVALIPEIIGEDRHGLDMKQRQFIRELLKDLAKRDLIDREHSGEAQRILKAAVLRKGVDGTRVAISDALKKATGMPYPSTKDQTASIWWNGVFLELERESAPPAEARSVFPEEEGKKAASLVDTLMYHILAMAGTAGEKDEDIVIGIDTSWIPGQQQAAIQGLLNRLSYISRKKGMRNIVVRRRKDAASLARALGEEVDKRGTPISNMIILAGENAIEHESLNMFRGNEVEKGAFFAGIQLPEDFGDNSYVRLVEMLEIAVNLAFGETVPEGTHPHIRFIRDERSGYRKYVFIPEATPLDINILSELYDIQREEISTRA
ncbi:MAG: hypothetical protein PHQ61_04800 [Candidatus Omnitrophica bacterium]|nr:hypothetical protein [Candidatus Omnitrophota bacterium]